MTYLRPCSWELQKLGFEPRSDFSFSHDPSASTVQPSESVLWCSV